MNLTHFWFRRAAAIATVAMLATASGASARSEVESLLDARPDGEIEIATIDGHLTIRGWQRSEIQIRGSLGDGVDQLQIEQADRWTRLTVERRANGERAAASDLSADLEIFVPEASSLVISALAAAVSIEGVGGTLNVETVTGHIITTGRPDSATLRSVSGSLDLQIDTPQLTARSVSGAITVRGQVGDLQAATVDAELRVEGSIGDEGRLSTVSGALHFDAALAAVARLRARSTSGALYVRAPSTDTKFSLASFSGELSNALGPGFGDGYRRKVEFGSGSRIVDLETFDGPIHLQSP